jgi:methyl-accepting chemotaxis protein
VTQAIGEVTTLCRDTNDRTVALSSAVAESREASTLAAERAGSSVSLGNQLHASAQGIVGVVAVISKIAAQTKLLALNATIESARAGEAGRGFGVVAEEVKRLAQQTQEATDDIAERIENIVADATSASDAFREIVEVVDTARSLQMTTVEAIAEQAETSRRIASVAEDAGAHALSIRESLAATTQAVGEAATGSSAMQDQAMRLLGMASELGRLTAAWNGTAADTDDSASAWT